MSRSSRSRASISKQRGRRDVLEVDAGEDRRDELDGPHDLVGVLRVEADRERVDAGEALEQRRLALHHGQRGLGAEVAEAEHGRPVGDDGDGVALDGEPPGVVGVLGDGQADARHAGRVDHRQVVAVADRDLRRDLDLAAEVHEEGPVRDLADRDAVDARAAPRRAPLACAVSVAAQVTSIWRCSCPEAVTSMAVTSPPACSTAAVSWLTALPRAGTSSRTVMEYETLGAVVMPGIVPPRLSGPNPRARRACHRVRYLSALPAGSGKVRPIGGALGDPFLPGAPGHTGAGRDGMVRP